jgi:rare lipoprotein A
MKQWRDAVGAVLLILMAALLNHPGLATASTQSESLWHRLLVGLVPGKNHLIASRSTSDHASFVALTAISDEPATPAANPVSTPAAGPAPIDSPPPTQAVAPPPASITAPTVLASLAPAAEMAPGTAVLGPVMPLPPAPPAHKPAAKLAAQSGCNGGQRIISAYYWEGRRTASGQPFNPQGMTAAHRTLPFGTHLTVSNPRTGKTVTVVINDRGPYVQGVGLDLSLGAAQAIGLHGTGSVCILSG